MTTTGSTAARVRQQRPRAGGPGSPQRPPPGPGRHGGIVRALRPDAVAVRLLVGVGEGRRRVVAMKRVHPAGIFEAPIADDAEDYRLEADYLQPGSGA